MREQDIELDIIEKTPEKEEIKKVRVRLLDRKKPRKKIKTSTKTKCPSTEDAITSSESISNQISETNLFSRDYNQPYAYYSIYEILELPKNYLFKYNNILLVGKLFGSSKNSYLIENKEMKNCCRIKLNFKLVKNVPDPETILSLYGSVEYEELGQSTVPVFMVRFYRYESEGLFKKYKENLKLIKKYVPSHYLESISR